MNQVDFSKWHGLGNDYIIVAAAGLGFNMNAARASAICDRHFGIGSDGILLWGGTESTGLKLEIYNPDGSRAEMCGNGIRMLARYLFDNNHVTKATFPVNTGAGIITPTVLPGGQVRVFMGQARLGGAGIIGYEGVRGESEALSQKIECEGQDFEFTFVDMGNPHCVIEVDNLEDLEIARFGPVIETHGIFPNRTNVEFMTVTGRAEVSMRVWERGVGETNACGTGACAVAVAAYRLRNVGSPVTVHLPGGDLLIEVSPEMEVNMTGPAEEIYSGSMSESFVNRLGEM